MDLAEEKDGQRPRVTTIFRSAQTPLGQIGEDMIEQKRQSNYHLNQPKPIYTVSSKSPAKTVREVSIPFT